MADSYIKTLEDKVFYYFLEELELSLDSNNCNSLKEVLQKYSESESLNSHIQMSYFVEKVLTPEFGITLRDLLSALKENKTTFKNYVMNIITKPEYKLQEALKKDGYNFKEDLLSALVGQSNDNNGSMSPVENPDPDDVKRKIIQKSLGNEDINLDDIKDEELDQLLARTTTIPEKVDIIRYYLNEKDENTIARYISHYTGMHLNEAIQIIKKDW